MSYLDVIKYYYLSLIPRVCVPVPPSCVHRDNRFISYIRKIISSDYMTQLLIQVLDISRLDTLTFNHLDNIIISSITYCESDSNESSVTTVHSSKGITKYLFLFSILK